MKNDTLDIDDCADQLREVLNHDIRHLEESLLRLNELRGLVIKRDNPSLSLLLGTIQSDSKPYRDNELKRQMLRQKLAALLGCGTEQMTLTRLEMELSGERKVELVRIKHKLQTLTSLLKKEYAGTRMLLADCSRFNRMLLKGIFEAGQPSATTYSPTGAAQRQTNTVFMNVQF